MNKNLRDDLFDIVFNAKHGSLDKYEAADQILQLVKDSLPEEAKKPDDSYDLGWNDFRTELLRRLGL